MQNLRPLFRLFATRQMRTTRMRIAQEMALANKLQVMNITVVNEQQKYNLELNDIASTLKKIMTQLNVLDARIELTFCSDYNIKKLNSEWRNVRTPTDILSFPANDFSGPADYSSEAIFFSSEEKHLGELYISPAYVERQCYRDEHENKDDEDDQDDRGVSKAMSSVFTLHERIHMLLIHGCLHLLGYDHETHEQWLQMSSKEDELLRSLNLIETKRA